MEEISWTDRVSNDALLKFKEAGMSECNKNNQGYMDLSRLAFQNKVQKER